MSTAKFSRPSTDQAGKLDSEKTKDIRSTNIIAAKGKSSRPKFKDFAFSL